MTIYSEWSADGGAAEVPIPSDTRPLGSVEPELLAISG